jgi:hypothetical protein
MIHADFKECVLGTPYCERHFKVFENVEGFVGVFCVVGSRHTAFAVIEIFVYPTVKVVIDRVSF